MYYAGSVFTKKHTDHLNCFTENVSGYDCNLCSKMTHHHSDAIGTPLFDCTWECMQKLSNSETEPHRRGTWEPGSISSASEKPKSVWQGCRKYGQGDAATSQWCSMSSFERELFLWFFTNNFLNALSFILYLQNMKVLGVMVLGQLFKE